MVQADQTTFSLKTEYSTPYGALIREDVVMGVSRYFIERWLPVLGTGPATVVNTLRQLDYRCHDGVVTIGGEALAREAIMSRRYLYTCLEAPWMKAFVRLESGQYIRDEAGKIAQQANRYFIRMDDPLTPADADHLLNVLTKLADTPLDAARRALVVEARELWAASPDQPGERFTELRAITARDVLLRAFPTWNPANDVEKQEFAQTAEALQRHITLTREDGRSSKIIVPQYFRKRWWKHLGNDLAWAYLWLRGHVYDNPDEGIRRNTCWIPALNALLTVIGRPREWWRRNVENAKTPVEDWSLTDFFEQIDSLKGRDPTQPQWVARQFSVTLDIPVAPEDQARYAELLKTWHEKPGFAPEPSPDETPPSDPPTDPGSATLTHTGSEGVSHTDAHRTNGGSPHSNTPDQRGSATLMHTGEGGVCHIDTQGSATPVHRFSVPIIEAPQRAGENFSSSKNSTPEIPPALQPNLNAAGAALSLPLIDQIAVMLENTPETPLYRCVAPQTWLRETWPEPVRPHTPAWTLVSDGQVSPRDLVALILSIWADTSIHFPPRYLSWLVQRWQTIRHMPPVDEWSRWCALADLPIGKWLDEGRREWLELTPRENRALPFGLDALEEESDSEDLFENTVYNNPFLSRTIEKPKPNGLDERPGAGKLTAGEIWSETLTRLAAQLNRSTYVNWVEGAKAVSYADGVLTIRARHAMAQYWLSERLNYSIQETVSSLAQMPITVVYVCDPPLRLPSD